MGRYFRRRRSAFAISVGSRFSKSRKRSSGRRRIARKGAKAQSREGFLLAIFAASRLCVSHSSNGHPVIGTKAQYLRAKNPPTFAARRKRSSGPRTLRGGDFPWS